MWLRLVAVSAGRVATGWELGDVEPRGVHFPPVISDGIPKGNGKVSQ